MGIPDDRKLKSCITLFASVSLTNPVFKEVPQKFFGGSKCQGTLRKLVKKNN